MILRHIRKGVELAPIIDDGGYDFNYQAFRYLVPPRRLLPVDPILRDCCLGRHLSLASKDAIN